MIGKLKDDRESMGKIMLKKEHFFPDVLLSVRTSEPMSWLLRCFLEMDYFVDIQRYQLILTNAIFLRIRHETP